MRYNIRRKRGMLQMSQYYEPEFKKITELINTDTINIFTVLRKE